MEIINEQELEENKISNRENENENEKDINTQDTIIDHNSCILNFIFRNSFKVFLFNLFSR